MLIMNMWAHIKIKMNFLKEYIKYINQSRKNQFYMKKKEMCYISLMIKK